MELKINDIPPLSQHLYNHLNKINLNWTKTQPWVCICTLQLTQFAALGQTPIQPVDNVDSPDYEWWFFKISETHPDNALPKEFKDGFSKCPKKRRWNLWEKPGGIWIRVWQIFKYIRIFSDTNICSYHILIISFYEYIRISIGIVFGYRFIWIFIRSKVYIHHTLIWIMTITMKMFERERRATWMELTSAGCEKSSFTEKNRLIEFWNFI